MAPPIASARTTAALKWAIGAIVVCGLLAAYLWTAWREQEFKADLRRIVSGELGHLTLCRFVGNPQPQPCRTIHHGDKDFAKVVGYLSQASLVVRPGKVAVADDYILKIGRASLGANDYLACYRATRYTGFDEIYISPIKSDTRCTWPETYEVGTVAIPGDAFGIGAI